MAKITDYSEVVQEITDQLDATETTIEEVLGRDLAILCVLNIYMTNDICQGFGQDFHNGVSVISSLQRISVIVGKRSSFFKDDFAICQYEDLSDDISEILMIWTAAYDRIVFDN